MNLAMTHIYISCVYADDMELGRRWVELGFWATPLLIIGES
jgi:hypothetical protein